MVRFQRYGLQPIFVIELLFLGALTVACAQKSRNKKNTLLPILTHPLSVIKRFDTFKSLKLNQFILIMCYESMEENK